MDNRPIGVFDSGLGGLTVLKEIKNLLPRESIVYSETAEEPLWFQIKRNCGKIYFSGHPVSSEPGYKNDCNRVQYGKRMQPGPGEKQF